MADNTLEVDFRGNYLLPFDSESSDEDTEGGNEDSSAEIRDIVLPRNLMPRWGSSIRKSRI